VSRPGDEAIAETTATIAESRRLREQLAAAASRLEVLLPLLEREIERYRRLEGLS
jgi:hypothetical protein